MSHAPEVCLPFGLEAVTPAYALCALFGVLCCPGTPAERDGPLVDWFVPAEDQSEVEITAPEIDQLPTPSAVVDRIPTPSAVLNRIAFPNLPPYDKDFLHSGFCHVSWFIVCVTNVFIGHKNFYFYSGGSLGRGCREKPSEVGWSQPRRVLRSCHPQLPTRDQEEVHRRVLPWNGEELSHLQHRPQREISLEAWKAVSVITVSSCVSI